MREIKAFNHPFKVYDIVGALKEVGFPNLSLTPCEGTGNFASDEEAYPSLEFPVSDSKIVKLELVCKDSQDTKAVTLIHEKGKTGEAGGAGLDRSLNFCPTFQK